MICLKHPLGSALDMSEPCWDEIRIRKSNWGSVRPKLQSWLHWLWENGFPTLCLSFLVFTKLILMTIY